MAGYAKKTLSLFLLASLCQHAAAAARVVQLVAENPSPFVSADPNDPKFIVSLFDDEDTALLLPEAAHTRSTLMTNAAGQQFNCSIPVSMPGASTAVSQLDAEMTPAYDLVKSPFELLEALEGMCLYRQDGLWTYEVCHRQQVRQFRQVSLQPGQVVMLDTAAAGGQAAMDGLLDALMAGDTAKLLGGVGSLLESGKKAEDFICGRYTGDEQQSESILEDMSSSGHPLKYVSHKLNGGASCVLTGRPRTAEVRYTCTRGSKDNVVLSVREFPTCNYVVVVSTPFLCKHPFFQPPEEDVRVMSCVPVDAQSDSDSDAVGQTASDSKAAATAGAEPAASDSQQAAASNGGAAAGGLQKRKWKRPSGANRSPEYVEDAAEGDELLLLRPQNPDDINDDYDDGEYMALPLSVRKDLQVEGSAAAAAGSIASSELSEQLEDDMLAVEEEERAKEKSKSEQQQQQEEGGKPVKDGAAVARDEL